MQVDSLFRRQNQHGSIYINKFTAWKVQELKPAVHLWDAFDPVGGLDYQQIFCFIDDVPGESPVKGVATPDTRTSCPINSCPEDVLGRDHTFLLRFCSVIKRAIIRLSSPI